MSSEPPPVPLRLASENPAARQDAHGGPANIWSGPGHLTQKTEQLQVLAMGFGEESAKAALVAESGNLAKAKRVLECARRQESREASAPPHPARQRAPCSDCGAEVYHTRCNRRARIQSLIELGFTESTAMTAITEEHGEDIGAANDEHGVQAAGRQSRARAGIREHRRRHQVARAARPNVLGRLLL